MTKEGSIHKMAEEIYDFVEERFADKDSSTRDMRRALRMVIDRLDFYEILYGITETSSLVYFPFEKGYKKRIFRTQKKGKNEERKIRRTSQKNAHALEKKQVNHSIRP